MHSILRQSDVNIRWVYTVNKIKNNFSNKDRCPLPLRSGVVYQFTCGVDPHSTYIGRTYRTLGVRVREHRTSRSAILDHRLSCDCSCDSNSFKILCSASDHLELNIKEALMIKRLSPKLNKQLSSNGSTFFCKVI